MAYDVAIAGGGPAGLVAATLLARSGARVVLAARRDRRPPRPGETLPGAAIRLLRTVALPVPAPDGPHRLLTGIASAWDGPPAETDYFRSLDGPSWLIERAAFDRSLKEAAADAGVALVEGAVEGAERSGAGWRLRGAGGPIAADFVVDATGRAARIGRGLGARIAV